MTGTNGVALPGESNNLQSQGTNGQQQGSPPQPDWSEFSRSIEGMGESLASRLTQELGGRLDQLHQTVQDGTPQPQQPDPNAGFDFDAATPRQLYDHMMGQFNTMMESTITQVLDQALNPYAEQITNLRRDMVTDQGGREIERLQSQNKDFADWVPEMKALAQSHPSLSIAQVFRLAKSENPDKAKQLDTKYNPPPPPPPRPFSLGPSNQGGDGINPSPKPMTKEQAALDAYSQVSARHPGVLAALDNAFPGH